MARMYVCESCEEEVHRLANHCGSCGSQLEDAFKALVRDVSKKLAKISGVKVEGDIIKVNGEEIKKKVIKALKSTPFFPNITEFYPQEGGMFVAKIT